MMTAVACPAWCVNVDCDREHWSAPGGATWPPIKANVEAGGRTPQAVAHPSWCEMDGLAPAVSVWVDSGQYDFTLDLTLDEAERLADQLLRAVRAVRQG